MRNITDELLVFIIAIVITGSMISFVVINDMREIKETKEFIIELNPDHKAYCEIAISREASEAHLRSEGCIR